jgi:hypothetical protein
LREPDQKDKKDQARLKEVFPRTKNGNFIQFPDPTTKLAASVVGLVTQKLNKHNPKGPFASSVGAADWVMEINPRRNDKDDAFRRNCTDAARSFLASWSGNPTTALGIHDETGVERDGNERTSAWLETGWNPHTDEKEDVWAAVGRRLKDMGHGSSSIIVFQRKESGDNHAVNGVNYEGKVVWVDPQQGRIGLKPMYNAEGAKWIVLNPEFQVVDAPPVNDPETFITSPQWAGV